LAGLFGTRAVLQTDLDLILQIVAVTALIVGFVYRKKVKRHGLILGAAAALEAGTFIAFMGPVFFIYLQFFFTQLKPVYVTFLAHAFTGSAALVLSIGLLASWIPRRANIGPCYQKRRKRLMDTAILLWIATVAIGVAGYLLAYVY
jgi:uncharacterized membrane protein YozB (DUF420 family)